MLVHSKADDAGPRLQQDSGYLRAVRPGLVGDDFQNITGQVHIANTFQFPDMGRALAEMWRVC